MMDLSKKQNQMIDDMDDHPGRNVGRAQLALHMSFAACHALLLDWENTSPSDIWEAIVALKVEIKRLKKALRLVKDAALRIGMS